MMSPRGYDYGAQTAWLSEDGIREPLGGWTDFDQWLADSCAAPPPCKAAAPSPPLTLEAEPMEGAGEDVEGAAERVKKACEILLSEPAPPGGAWADQFVRDALSLAQRGGEGLSEALEMTGCRDLVDLIDMANVGKSTMGRMAEVIRCPGPFHNWNPADDPAEIITDLFNALEEIAAAPSPPLTLEADPTEGWMLVPREPGSCEGDDSGWVLAFFNGLHAHLPEDQRPTSWMQFSDDQRERIKSAYRAMLAAAPPPPGPTEGVRTADDGWQEWTASRPDVGEKPDWWPLKRFGYAPGNYMILCMDCNVRWGNCDKRARRCRLCAEERLRRTPPEGIAPPVGLGNQGLSSVGMPLATPTAPSPSLATEVCKPSGGAK